MNDDKKDPSVGDKMKADFVDGATSAAKYGMTGAVIGSVVPVVGTMAGALAGAMVGGFISIFSDPKKPK